MTCWGSDSSMRRPRWLEDRFRSADGQSENRSESSRSVVIPGARYALQKFTNTNRFYVWPHRSGICFGQQPVHRIAIIRKKPVDGLSTLEDRTFVDHRIAKARRPQLESATSFRFSCLRDPTEKFCLVPFQMVLSTQFFLRSCYNTPHEQVACTIHLKLLSLFSWILSRSFMNKYDWRAKQPNTAT